MTELFDKLKYHDWASVKAFSDRSEKEPTMESYVVKCSSDGMIFVVLSLFRLDEPDEVDLKEHLSSVEMSKLEQVFPQTSWQSRVSAIK